MSKKNTESQKWNQISVVELLIISILFALNMYLGNSADYNDFSAVLLLVIIIGIILQIAVFIHVKPAAWRVFIFIAIALHLVVVPYLLFLVSFSSYAN